MWVAHFAFEFCARYERRYRIDHDDVDCTATDQDFSNFQRLLAAVRLRYQEVVDIDAELPRIVRVQGVLSIHEGCRAAELLSLGDGMQRQGRFATRLRSEHFDDSASRVAPDTERSIQRQRSRGNRIQRRCAIDIAQTHDGTLAKLLFDLRHSQINGP